MIIVMAGAAWTKAALVGLSLVVGLPEAIGFSGGSASLEVLARSNAASLGSRQAMLPLGARAGGLPQRQGAGRGGGAASLRAQYVPSKEDKVLSNKNPDHPVLKNPCVITDRTTGEKVEASPLLLFSPAS